MKILIWFSGRVTRVPTVRHVAQVSRERWRSWTAISVQVGARKGILPLKN